MVCIDHDIVIILTVLYALVAVHAVKPCSQERSRHHSKPLLTFHMDVVIFSALTVFVGSPFCLLLFPAGLHAFSLAVLSPS